MKINPYEVAEKRLATGIGLDKYAYIMKMVHEKNVSKDEDFQRVFNNFYRVRRNLDWRKKYYQFFEENKDKKISFADIISWLYDQTGNIEASFSSKMFATIYPNKPIWDKYVLENLGLKPMGKNEKERLDNAVEVYTSIENWYNDFLKTDNAKECINAFNKILPSYRWVSDVKKIDFFLWSIR